MTTSPVNAAKYSSVVLPVPTGAAYPRVNIDDPASDKACPRRPFRLGSSNRAKPTTSRPNPACAGYPGIDGTRDPQCAHDTGQRDHHDDQPDGETEPLTDHALIQANQDQPLT